MIKIYTQRSQLHTTFSFNFQPFVWCERKTVDRRCWWGAEFAVKRTLTSSHESLWSAAFVGLTHSRFLRRRVWQCRMNALPSLFTPRTATSYCLLSSDRLADDASSASSALAILQTILRECGLICRNYYDSFNGVRHNL